jgi:hypothetical protein
VEEGSCTIVEDELEEDEVVEGDTGNDDKGPEIHLAPHAAVFVDPAPIALCI